MKVYAAPDDTTLGRKIRNALEAIAVDEERLGALYSGGVEWHAAALVAPGPFATRYVMLVYIRECPSASECQSARAPSSAWARSSARALASASALSIASLRRASLKVETISAWAPSDGVVLTVKHDRCHSQIYRERPSAREAE